MDLVIGTRKSQLALIQTQDVEQQIRMLYPDWRVLLLAISTTGDKILDTPRSLIGPRSLFTKELEMALLEGEADIVVHSAKDLSTAPPKGLGIAVVLEREDPRDALVMREGATETTFEELKPGSVIGTGNVRRIAQLKRLFPHLEFQDIHGNLNTRLLKLDSDNFPYSAVVLGVAELKRLELEERITKILTDFPYAVGQGALAVECREKDKYLVEKLKPLEHWPTRLVVEAERAMLKVLGGGCSTPIGVISEWKDTNTLNMRVYVTSTDGKEQRTTEKEKKVTSISEARAFGGYLARVLRDSGARDILK